MRSTRRGRSPSTASSSPVHGHLRRSHRGGARQRHPREVHASLGTLDPRLREAWTQVGVGTYIQQSSPWEISATSPADSRRRRTLRGAPHVAAVGEPMTVVALPGGAGPTRICAWLRFACGRVRHARSCPPGDEVWPALSPRRCTSGAHQRERCRPRMRTAEISSAGQGRCGGEAHRSGTRRLIPGLQAGSPHRSAQAVESRALCPSAQRQRRCAPVTGRPLARPRWRVAAGRHRNR